MGAKKYIDKIGETETHRLADGRTITLRLKGFNTFEKIWHTNIVNALSHCPDKRSVFDLLNEVIMTDEQKEHWQRHGITLDDMEAGLMFANEQSGILTPTMVKWINMWFAEQREPQPLPSSGNADDVTTPDTSNFSHMESFNPTIPFDMSALYTFLKDEGVIRDIDEPLFADCIMHAHMNEVWEVGNHHKLKCVFRHVKDHFPNDWIDVVAQRMNTTRKKITAFQRDKIRDFERKLRNIV